MYNRLVGLSYSNRLIRFGAASLVLVGGLAPSWSRGAAPSHDQAPSDEAYFANLAENACLANIPGRMLKLVDPGQARTPGDARWACLLRAMRPSWGNSTLSRVAIHPLHLLGKTSNLRLSAFCVRHQ